MSNSESIAKFIERATGRFTGPEEIVTDPQSMSTMTGVAHMDNTPALGGAAVASAYVQEVGGAVTMRCETLIRVSPDLSVVLVWTPSEGDPGIFAGTLDGAAIDVSRTDSDGILQRIRTDYGDPSAVTNEMTMTFPGVDQPMTVYSGQYERTNS